MNFNEYQKTSQKTKVYPGQGEFTGLCYAALGLSGESGEVANKVKKAWRDGGIIDDERRRKILEECGDTLWYVARVCDELMADMDTVAMQNIVKLETRQANGTLKVHD